MIGALMPMSTDSALPDLEDDWPDVHGLPGLRYTFEGATVVLYRPRLPGRIKTPLADADLWDKAVLIAQADYDDSAVFYWDTSPAAAPHPCEGAFTAAWPQLYQAGHRHSRVSRLASDALRHLLAICKPSTRHDMWFNYGARAGTRASWSDRTAAHTAGSLTFCWMTRSAPARAQSARAPNFAGSGGWSWSTSSVTPRRRSSYRGEDLGLEPCAAPLSLHPASHAAALTPRVPPPRQY
ncbi:hypothetical protein ACQEU3_44665 [Spirillospora sp. CA-253888]